jgi:hypothetical protein
MGGSIFMSVSEYQLILFPTGNMPKLTEEGMDFDGPNNFDFTQAVKILTSMDHIKNNNTAKSWYSLDDECYFVYDNGKSKIEIELNAGTKDEKADLISLRTNIFNEDGSIVDALKIGRILSESLSLSCWNMKLRNLLEINDDQDVEITINHFYSLRNK